MLSLLVIISVAEFIESPHPSGPRRWRASRLSVFSDIAVNLEMIFWRHLRHPCFSITTTARNDIDFLFGVRPSTWVHRQCPIETRNRSQSITLASVLADERRSYRLCPKLHLNKRVGALFNTFKESDIFPSVSSGKDLRIILSISGTSEPSVNHDLPSVRW